MMKKNKRTWYYVSYYEEYPIYEPAEGGYYYAGNELIESYRVRTLAKARRLLKRLAQEYSLVQRDKNYANEHSKYIGEGRSMRIETIQGINERGREVYC